NHDCGTTTEHYLLKHRLDSELTHAERRNERWLLLKDQGQRHSDVYKRQGSRSTTFQYQPPTMRLRDRRCVVSDNQSSQNDGQNIEKCSVPCYAPSSRGVVAQLPPWPSTQTK
ncbi:hypothetical protein C0J52_27196, partial [Blattella germanica]